MSDNLWVYVTLLLLGYALGATMIGKGGHDSTVVVAAAEPYDYGGKGCTSIIILLVAGLLFALLLTITTGDL